MPFEGVTFLNKCMKYVCIMIIHNYSKIIMKIKTIRMEWTQRTDR